MVDLNKPLRPQAEAAVGARDANRHIDENDEPNTPGFGRAVVDKFDVGNALDYKNRYQDFAYFSIRGREQQLIDFHGGARSDTRPSPNRTENPIRGVAKDHRFGRIFHEAASYNFGELHPYTGYPKQ